MERRPALAALAIIGAAAIVAIVAGAVASRVVPGISMGASAAAAVAVAATFARWPLHGLAAFLLTGLLADTAEHWAGISLRLFDEVSIPLLVIAVAAFGRDRIVLGRPSWREWGLVLFLASGIASALLGGVPADVWIPGLVLLVKGFVVFYLVLALRVGVDELTPVALAGFAILAVMAAIGFIEFLAPTAVRDVLRLPPYDAERGGLTVVKSIFLHPALYGWLTAFLSLFLYARFAVLRSAWALVGAVVLNVGTLLSGRRTPLIGVVAGLIAGAARQAAGGWMAFRVWVPIAGILLLFVAISLPVLGRFYERTLSEYVAPPDVAAEIFRPEPDPLVLRQMQPRIGLYLGSVAIARDQLPLGVGIGRFGSHMSREVYSPIYAEYGMDRMYGIQPGAPIAVTDTFWPMILGETGVLGLLGALAFFGFLGSDLWRAAGVRLAPAVRAAVLGAGLIYIEALIRSLTSAVFVAPPIAYVVFVTVALALAVARSAERTVVTADGG